jgi:AraC family transcriptional regulator of adaptative response/methylated-DNA-[protein]-cysteine methyltransferase
VIAYASAATSVGRVLVGATERGLCSVKAGTSEAELVRALRREFPEATIRRDPAGVGVWLRRVLATIDGRAPKEALPLDIRATAFQRRVWEALVRIPRGETRTYGEIARSIGKPRAARAVGRACATNPVAIVVPCHRVVGSGGALTGYAYGVEVKRALLEREGAATASTAARPTRSKRARRARSR